MACLCVGSTGEEHGREELRWALCRGKSFRNTGEPFSKGLGIQTRRALFVLTEKPWNVLDATDDHHRMRAGPAHPGHIWTLQPRGEWELSRWVYWVSTSHLKDMSNDQAGRVNPVDSAPVGNAYTPSRARPVRSISNEQRQDDLPACLICRARWT